MHLHPFIRIIIIWHTVLHSCTVLYSDGFVWLMKHLPSLPCLWYLPHMRTHVNCKHSVAPPLLITSLPSLVIIQRSVCANGTSPKPEILLRLSHSTKYWKNWFVNLFANFRPFFFFYRCYLSEKGEVKGEVTPDFWKRKKKEEITSSFIRFIHSGTSSQFSLHGPIFSTNISLCTSITWTLPHFWVGPFPLKLGKTWD